MTLMNYTRVPTAFMYSVHGLRFTLIIGIFLYMSSLVPGYLVYVYMNYLVQGYLLSLCIHELSCTQSMQMNVYGLFGCMYMYMYMTCLSHVLCRGNSIVCWQKMSCTFIARACLYTSTVFYIGIYPVEFGPAYAASKHGVIGYTRSWAVSDVINFCCII